MPKFSAHFDVSLVEAAADYRIPSCDVHKKLVLYILEKCPTAKVCTTVWPITGDSCVQKNPDFNQLEITVSNFGKPNYWGRVVIPELERLAKEFKCKLLIHLNYPVSIVLTLYPLDGELGKGG